jgi:glucosyl-3-phosphoglycerate synthase
MSEEVGAALFRAVEEGGVAPDYGTLPGRYVGTVERFLRGYAVDSAFNGLEYDRVDEREQVVEYADAIAPPGEDDRLPTWEDAPVSAEAVRETARADLDAAREEAR